MTNSVAGTTICCACAGCVTATTAVRHLAVMNIFLLIVIVVFGIQLFVCWRRNIKRRARLNRLMEERNGQRSDPD